MDEPGYNLVMPGLKRLWWIVMIVCATVPVAAQQATRSAAAVAGTVMSADLGRPISRAVVNFVPTSPARSGR
jgi:predicted secreted protein